MYKIAVVGDYDSIYGFAALGLDTFPVTAQEEAGERLQELAAGGYDGCILGRHRGLRHRV